MEYIARNEVSLGSRDGFSRVARGEGYVQFTDISTSGLYQSGEPYTRALVDLCGGHTTLSVPLAKDDTVMGVLAFFRQEVKPFTDKEIALVKNFAAQAVIAMENARLLTETREALEQQTATAEVLQVINSSPGNLQPVFDKLTETAARLCETDMAGLAIRDGDAYRYVAHRSLNPAWEAYLSGLSFTPGRGTITGRTLLERKVIHIADLAADPEHTVPAAVTIGGLRTFLGVPLLREGEPIGVLSLLRHHVEPFTDRQISLVKTFADQAVIAMENARLITETREALEQQTATAEVLQVINASPGNLQPVFDAMLEKATRLCEAASGHLYACEGEAVRLLAAYGDLRLAEHIRQRGLFRPWLGVSQERILRGEQVVHIVDVLEDQAYRAMPTFEQMSALNAVRTLVSVALHKDDALLGILTIYRRDVRAFSDKEIALLQNFAAQAVIAMENAHLLEEIRQRQQELRVTFDNIADGVAMFDSALQLTAWNRHFQEMLDLSDAYLAERHTYDEYVRYLIGRGEFGDVDPEAELARLRQAIDEHSSYERTRPDGTIIDVRFNQMPDGGFVVIYSDITERKRSEAEIHAARDAAEAAYRDLKATQASLIQAEKMASLGQLTAGIAHEIKNPLNFVNNFAGLSVELLDELKETTAPAVAALGDEKRAEIDETITMLTGNLEKIAEHGRRADGIVKSMLEHSRGSSGERRSVDLNSLIDEALNLAYHGGRAQDASFNITLERDLAEAIAPIELVPQDITRVCLNLFSNGFYAATKRQKQGGDPKFKPTLKVSTRDLGDAVEINIRDNGVGISPEIKDKLFQPFFTTKPTGEGTGLGLSISYDIVTQEHGGTISIDSQIGEFTEFTLRLPRVYGATIAEAVS